MVFCKHPVCLGDKIVSVADWVSLFFRRLLPFPVCFKHLEVSGQWAHWTLFDMQSVSQSAPLTLCSLHNLEHWSSVRGTLSVLVCCIRVCKNLRFLRLCLSHLRLSIVRLLTLSCNLAIVFSWISTSSLRKSVKQKKRNKNKQKLRTKIGKKSNAINEVNKCASKTSVHTTFGAKIVTQKCVLYCPSFYPKV